MDIVICIISLIIAIVIVNKAQQLYMNLIGADFMFFSGKKKILAIFIVFLFVAGFILKIFGLA